MRKKKEKKERKSAFIPRGSDNLTPSDPHMFIFVSSDHTTFFQSSVVQCWCCLAQLYRAFMCLVDKNGFFFLVLASKPIDLNALLTVVMETLHPPSAKYRWVSDADFSLPVMIQRLIIRFLACEILLIWPPFCFFDCRSCWWLRFLYLDTVPSAMLSLLAVFLCDMPWLSRDTIEFLRSSEIGFIFNK